MRFVVEPDSLESFDLEFFAEKHRRFPIRCALAVLRVNTSCAEVVEGMLNLGLLVSPAFGDG
ncbi:MAG: hypothetical protein CO090_07170 [Acidobacteria bacterium CG_4_9_14_3_um_filter_49_7]|nr:MAG: hypothetical protein CO090_07170 [Acidobacteria bacterium CG_4_9_14_3_um_filter_49_7]